MHLTTDNKCDNNFSAPCNYGYSVIDDGESRKIYRLSDDERKWIEVEELPEIRGFFRVASLNRRIYITGGW